MNIKFSIALAITGTTYFMCIENAHPQSGPCQLQEKRDSGICLEDRKRNEKMNLVEYSIKKYDECLTKTENDLTCCLMEETVKSKNSGSEKWYIDRSRGKCVGIKQIFLPK